jgi:hypothetical protein
MLRGFVPYYPVLMATKKEEAKRTNSEFNYIEFYRSALHISMSDLLELEKDKNGLQIDIPGVNTCFLHVRFVVVVGDIKGHHPMVCHCGNFSSNVRQILPSCDCSYSEPNMCLDFKRSPIYIPNARPESNSQLFQRLLLSWYLGIFIW